MKNIIYKQFINMENDIIFLFLEMKSLATTLREMSRNLTIDDEVIKRICIVRDRIMELDKFN